MLTYDNVNVPTDESPEDLSRAERRSAVLRAVADAGHPEAVHQSTLADRLGVHQSTISRDIDALRREIADSIGRDSGHNVTVSIEFVTPGGEIDGRD